MGKDHRLPLWIILAALAGLDFVQLSRRFKCVREPDEFVIGPSRVPVEQFKQLWRQFHRCCRILPQRCPPQYEIVKMHDHFTLDYFQQLRA